MTTRYESPYAAPGPDDYVLAEAVPTDTEQLRPREFPTTPVLLFLACCVTTYLAGGWMYAVAVLGILLCHEFGHYIQARRYGVPASLPYFIPMPLGPIGTMGAVIGMRGNMGNRRALYDIGITGPLAGLVPTLICCYVGLSLSRVAQLPPGGAPGMLQLGEPLLFRGLAHWFFGPLAENQVILGHPLAIAGWVGLFITALNLIPIGQLDGGHVLYAMLREKAHYVAWAFTIAAFAGVILAGEYGWSLMLMLILFMGPAHPPTANDEMPLGTGRIVLGWLTLAFVIIGFTPTPFIMT
jgi:membrane-associated protease RseP (regulator of RpoE activity)